MNRIPSNPWEQAEFTFDARGIRLAYLLDEAAVGTLEEVGAATGVDLFAAIESRPGRTYMVTNEVAVQLLNRSRPVAMPFLNGHIVNLQAWSVVVTCQRHDRLILVTDDANLAAIAGQAIGQERIKSARSLVAELLETEAKNPASGKAFSILDTGSNPASSTNFHTTF